MSEKEENVLSKKSDAEEVKPEIAETEIAENKDTVSLEEENSETEEKVRSFEDVVAALEALLFTTGEAVSSERLMTALKINRKKFNEAMTELTDRFETDDHGIRIIRLDDSWQMCTKEKYYEDLIALEVAPKAPSMTEVMMETLSIIAYKQPVTKAEIQRIRGVNSDHAVNKLIEYKLVRELGRLNAPGRPILFGTTEEFLRCFGVSSAEDLPAIDSMKVEDFKAEAEEEAKNRVEVEM